jgi:hypothetical protein
VNEKTVVRVEPQSHEEIIIIIMIIIINPTAMFIRETTWPHPAINNSARIQAFTTTRNLQFAEFGVDKNTQNH